MIIDLYVREYEDTWDEARKHGFINTDEVFELERLFERHGVLLRNDQEAETDGAVLTHSFQFVFNAPDNKLYLELSFGVE